MNSIETYDIIAVINNLNKIISIFHFITILSFNLLPVLLLLEYKTVA